MGLITSMGIKTILRSKKNKKSRYAITNVSMKNLSKTTKEFEKFPFNGYVRKRPKHGKIYHDTHVPGPVDQSSLESEYNTASTAGMDLTHFRMLFN